jgi:hypothetical protein
MTSGDLHVILTNASLHCLLTFAIRAMFSLPLLP